MTEATPRGAMTPARKRRIWERENGRCLCGAAVPVGGPGVTYDHWVPLWMGGDDDDAQVFPQCDGCAKPKTAADATRRAKVKRLLKRALGQPRPRSRLRGKGFRMDIRRRMDNVVEERKPRRKR